MKVIRVNQAEFLLKATSSSGVNVWSLDHSFTTAAVTAAGLDTTIDVSSENGVVEVTLSSATPWETDLTFDAIFPLDSSLQVTHSNWPTYVGSVDRRAGVGRIQFEFRGAGWNSPAHDGRRLAIPAVILETATGFVVAGTDPGFSVEIAHDPATRTVEMHWTYRASAGIHNGIVRRIFCRQVATLSEALDLWFTLATPNVPAGPQWLHEIVWQNFDFMSKDGDGWFDDIDAVCEIVELEERKKVAFTLHGWYDEVGRYCLNRETGLLDQQWMVFPHINDPRLQASDYVSEIGNHPRAYKFRNTEHYKPIEMSWDEIRRRLEYAKAKGFRVPFYLVTGLMDLGNVDSHWKIGDGLQTEGAALWTGPDAVGETYIANPLDPRVRDRYLTLTREVLSEVGDLIDALVIDEAYYIGYGQMGPSSRPGYADLAQATLFWEIAQLCHAHRSDIALLTADHVGTQGLENQAFPYSLFADGIYHDAWNHPQAQLATTFPAWRNIAWSCLWAPSSALANTKWAVLAHDATIATSNGCFGDDVGVAQMSKSDVADLRGLWEVKRGMRKRPRIKVVDSEPIAVAPRPSSADG